MPKTIAITPSWYWPAGTTRVTGVPPFSLDQMLLQRFARHSPDQPALVSGALRLSAADLAAAVHAAAGSLAGRVEAGGCAVLCAGPSAEGVVLLFAALAAGVRVRLVDPGAGAVALAAASSSGCAAVTLADAAGAEIAAAGGAAALRLDGLDSDGGAGAVAQSSTSLDDAAVAVPVGAAVADTNIMAWHSHHSLLAQAVSLTTFYKVDGSVPWVAALPLASWEGLTAVTVPLFAGATLVLPDGAPLPEAIGREGAGYAFTDLETAVALTRDAKRDVKGVRGVLRFLAMSVQGMFDPDQRRRVGRSFDCPALTVFGTAETGPIFASHPSWYLDESVGIPVTNAHVVPVDPRSGVPIQTLWELVESARVTVASPGCMVGYGSEATAADPVVDGRVVTSTIASSDANGMIYLLPEGP